MKLCRIVAGVSVFLAACSDMARAMGSGPHPHLLYGIPSGTGAPQLATPGAEAWLPPGLLLLAGLAGMAVIALRARKL